MELALKLRENQKTDSKWVRNANLWIEIKGVEKITIDKVKQFES
jgi:hypothetical protein